MLNKLFKKGPKDTKESPTYEDKDVIKVQSFIRGALCRARVSAMVEKMIEEMLEKKKKNATLDRSSHHSTRSLSTRDRSTLGSSVRNIMAKYEESPSPSPTKKVLPPRKKLAIPGSFLQTKPEERKPEEGEPEEKVSEESEAEEPEVTEPEENEKESNPEEKSEVATKKQVVTDPISKKKTWPPSKTWPPKKVDEEDEEKEETPTKNVARSAVIGKRTWPPPSKWSSPRNAEEKQSEEEKVEETQDSPIEDNDDKEKEVTETPKEEGIMEETPEEKKKPETPAKVEKSNSYVKNIQLKSNATKNVSSSQRVIEEQKARIDEEIKQLLKDVQRIGDPEEPSVEFGVLFDNEEVANYYEALVGTLKAAKKKGLVKYDGQFLMKGVHDKVVISIA